MATMTTPEEQRGLSRLETLRGMRRWNLSGAFGAVYSAVTAGAYSTGYALHLGASNALIGFLSAAPSWGQVLQMFSPLLIERLKRRKPLCMAAYAIGYSMWLPIALIPFIFVEALRPWAMIVLVAIAGATFALASPASTSWLTDLVPAEVRGRFVARQQSIAAAVGLAASLAAGRYLDLFPDKGKQGGFVSLFIIAVLFALAAIAAWALVPEPPKRTSGQRSIIGFLTLPFRHANFRNFTMFVSVRAMAAMIAGPFFAVYMLKTLEIPYAQIALFSAASSLSSMAANPLWGYLADKFGYKPILRISSFAIALVPLPWVFTTKSNYWFIVPAVQVWMGFMSSGLVISQFNLMLKTAPAENRSVYLGCYSAVVNIAFSLGSMVGGALADVFSHLGSLYLLGRPISNLQCVFLVSTLLRLLGLSFLRRVKEEEAVAARVVLEQVRRSSPLVTLWNLLRMLRSSDAATKAQATKALGSARSVLAVDELIAALDDSDREVRREAARALGEIGDERALQPLIEKLRDPLADIVEESAEALGKIRAPQSLEPLVQLLSDPHPSVRKSAVLALGEMHDPRAERPLEDLLERETESAVFLATTEALSKIGGRRALHRLRTLLRNSSPGVGRKQLANSIGNLLGAAGEFYKLLEAEPMTQEAMVARVLTTSRRRLGGQRAGGAEDRAYIEVHLDAGLQRFVRRQYAGAIDCLRQVASRATRSFADSERCAALLAARHRAYRPDLRVEKKVGLLLETNRRLRINFGFLHGLHRESRNRSLHLEEALLGVFAFQQVVAELVRVARGRGDG